MVTPMGWFFVIAVASSGLAAAAEFPAYDEFRRAAVVLIDEALQVPHPSVR